MFTILICTGMAQNKDFDNTADIANCAVLCYSFYFVSQCQKLLRFNAEICIISSYNFVLKFYSLILEIQGIQV